MTENVCKNSYYIYLQNSKQGYFGDTLGPGTGEIETEPMLECKTDASQRLILKRK